MKPILSKSDTILSLVTVVETDLRKHLLAITPFLKSPTIHGSKSVKFWLRFLSLEYDEWMLNKSGGNILSNTNKKIKSVRLSRNTLASRIAENLRDQHHSTTSTFQAYSIAIDEGTDIRKIAQLAIFIRGFDVNLK
ncbi:general transcription factor II-I repeat domain-containing protein 2 [Trichonephila clavipes]|nr:general transcription factor II-I repeat domain-containing protein 2 [Trichonephila clavipes]